MSAGELESGNAGEPAKLVRQRYREASDIIKKGKLCSLFINDLDAGGFPASAQDASAASSFTGIPPDARRLGLYPAWYLVSVHLLNRLDWQVTLHTDYSHAPFAVSIKAGVDLMRYIVAVQVLGAWAMARSTPSTTRW